jgi:hypothetical protein
LERTGCTNANPFGTTTIFNAGTIETTIINGTTLNFKANPGVQYLFTANFTGTGTGTATNFVIPGFTVQNATLRTFFNNDTAFDATSITGTGNQNTQVYSALFISTLQAPGIITITFGGAGTIFATGITPSFSDFFLTAVDTTVNG